MKIQVVISGREALKIAWHGTGEVLVLVIHASDDTMMRILMVLRPAAFVVEVVKGNFVLETAM